MLRPAAILLWVSSACAIAADPEPKKPAPPKADVRGKIETVTLYAGKTTGTVGTIRVEGAKEKDTQHDKAMVRIQGKSTRIYKWVDGKKKEAKLEDLKKGAKVQVQFGGPVAESYPVQGTAKEVLILETAKDR